MLQRGGGRMNPVCVCGHEKSEHAGKTCRGVCFVCYGNSDHGREWYCSRFRLPKG